jgi:hypothetical protein
MRRTSKKKQEIRLKLANQFGFQVQRLDMSRAVLLERNEIQAAERRGVLVLFTDRFTQNIVGDVESALSQLIF